MNSIYFKFLISAIHSIANYTDVPMLRNLIIDWSCLGLMLLQGVKGKLSLEIVSKFSKLASQFLNFQNDRLQIVSCRIIEEIHKVATTEDWRKVN